MWDASLLVLYPSYSERVQKKPSPSRRWGAKFVMLLFITYWICERRQLKNCENLWNSLKYWIKTDEKWDTLKTNRIGEISTKKRKFHIILKRSNLDLLKIAIFAACWQIVIKIMITTTTTTTATTNTVYQNVSRNITVSFNFAIFSHKSGIISIFISI